MRTLISVVIATWMILVSTAAWAKTQVAVTLYPIHLLVQGIADQEHFELICMQKTGDTHDLAVSAKDIASLKNVKLLITSELGLDNALVKTVKKAWPKLHIVNVSPKHGLIKFDHDQDHEGHEHEGDKDHDHHREGHKNVDDHNHEDTHGHHHDHGSVDPHIWLGLDNAEFILNAVAKELIRLEPSSQKAVHANLKAALLKIDGLQQLSKSKLSKRSIKLIAFHSAWAYFERSTGVIVVDSISINPDSEPSAQRVKDLVKLARQHKINGFVVETGMPDKAIRTINRELKLPVVELNPLDTVGKQGFEHYINEMKGNILSLAALK